LLPENHPWGCVQQAVNDAAIDAAIKEMVTVLGKALRQ
jgi:hypothetical protein